ncbi:MAG: hypothetical protein JWN14_127 [Chthonomonadales bacterium]|nr:hypothetical protein [Chthonomonadales bacterium]
MFRNVAFPIFLLVLVGALLSAGCGGGKSAATSGGGAITDAQRMAVLDAVQQKFPTLDGDPPAIRQAVKNFLVGLPHIEAADVDEDSGCVWARFTDHIPLIVVNNRKPSTTATVKSSATRAVELPANAQIRILNALGTSFVSSATTVRVWLTANGYSSVSSDASLDALRTVSGDGVFYLDAHGGVGQLIDHTRSFAIWTATRATIDQYKALQASQDINAANPRVVLMYATHNGTAEWHFGITHAFVGSYMSFGANSLVYFNTCLSNGSIAQLFQDTCLAKGASVYAGWTRSVKDPDANKAAQFLFDRLAGVNQPSVVPTETPPQRAFNWQAVYADMQSRGYDTSTDKSPGDCKLIFTPNPNEGKGDFSLLAPSISSLLITNYQTQLHLFGIFGSKAGKVTIGGQNAALLSPWSSTSLTCTLPPGDQAGGSGDVVVEVDGHKSNAVPLTMWKITIHAVDKATQSGTIVLQSADNFGKEIDADLGGSTTASGDMVVWIRADVHGSRTQPGATPQMPSPQDPALVSSILPTQNVRLVRWDASGATTADLHAPGEAVFEHRTLTLAPTGSPPVLFDGSDPTRARREAASASIDAQAHTIQLYVGPYGTGLYQTTVVSDKTGTSMQDGGGISFHPDNTSNGPVSFNIQLDSDFNVQSGSQSETYSQPAQGISGIRTFSWSGQVSSPPSANTTRKATRGMMRSTTPASWKGSRSAPAEKTATGVRIR